MQTRPARLLIVLLALWVIVPHAAPVDDRADITQAVLDYVEGFYGGEPARVARAVSPALSKRQLIARPGAAPVLAEMNADTLVEAANGVKLAPADRQLTTEVLMAGAETASARLYSARFNDYVHLVKRNGAWQIVNVLWHAPPTAPAPDQTDAVRGAVRLFVEVMTGAATPGASPVLHPLAHVRVFAPGRQGRPRYLIDQNADTFLAGLARGAGKLPGTAADAAVVVEGIDQDIASARVQSGTTTLHLHLARWDGTWRVVTMLQFTAAAPAQH